MRSGNEIKRVGPFKNEFEKLLFNIDITSSWLHASYNETLKPYGLTSHQYNVLRILKGGYPGSYSNQDISLRMVDRSSNATRIVDKLLQKQLVIKTGNNEDRRLVNIKINDKGLRLLAQIEKICTDETNPLKKLDEEKSRLMNSLLDELRS